MERYINRYKVENKSTAFLVQNIMAERWGKHNIHPPCLLGGRGGLGLSVLLRCCSELPGPRELAHLKTCDFARVVCDQNRLYFGFVLCRGLCQQHSLLIDNQLMSDLHMQLSIPCKRV